MNNMIMLLIFTTVFGNIEIDFTLREEEGEFVNEYNEALDFAAGDDKVIVGIYSEHDNYYEDRRWRFTTSSVPDLKCNPLSMTSFRNEYDGPLDFTCPENQALAALKGVWGVDDDSNRNDRRFQFRCCDISSPTPDGVARYRIESVTDEPYVNDFDNIVNTKCNRNSVIVGLASFHDNHREDRRWQIKCGLVIPNEARADVDFAQTLTRDRYVVGGLVGGTHDGQVKDSTCQPGQVEFASVSSNENSEKACRETCAQNSFCRAFDYTTTPKGDACRLVGANTPRLGDPGADNRRYCTMRTNTNLCFKSGVAYEPLGFAIVSATTAECQAECSKTDSCAKWTLIGSNCYLTGSNAHEVAGNGIIGPRIGCYDRRETTFVVVKEQDCSAHGMEFITDRDECIRAGNSVGITNSDTRNNPSANGNRQKHCGTWEGLTFLHFNPQNGGDINGFPILQTAGQDINGPKETYQICKTSGWTARYDHPFDFEIQGTPVVVDVGHNLEGAASKLIPNAGTNLVCPSKVGRSNRVSLDNERLLEDTFQIEVVDGTDLRVTRLDGVSSWSLFLRVPCYDVGNHALLAGMISQNSRHYNDRQFKFYSASAPGLKCDPNPWTDYQNEFEGKVEFSCPDGHALSGVGSFHDDGTEDRRFRFRCCNVEQDGYAIAGSRFLGNTDFESTFDAQCANNEVMIGFHAYYDGDEHEDRRFNILCGVLVRAAPDFDDCTEIVITEVEVGTPEFGEPIKQEATLQSFQTDFNACGRAIVPEEFHVESSGSDEIEKSDTIELTETLDQHYTFSSTVETSLTYGQSASVGIEKGIASANLETRYEYSVGFSATQEGGWDIGTSSSESTTTGNTKVSATAVDITFKPLPFQRFVAIGTYFKRSVKVPVKLTTKCIRRDGQEKIMDVDSFYTTSGTTTIEIRYEDRTNSCEESYYRNCECVTDLGSEFVGAQCQVHPVFDGNKGCYVYAGNGNTDCHNGQALGTAEPIPGIPAGPSNFDQGVNGVSFAWSYKPCGGLQYYPGDPAYSGPSFDDLVLQRTGRHCQFGHGGTLSQEPYGSRNTAIVACYLMNEQTPNKCFGVYDASCDNLGEFFLCAAEGHELPGAKGAQSFEDLTISAGGDNPSCVYEMQDLSPNPAFSPFPQSNELTPFSSQPFSPPEASAVRVTSNSESKTGVLRQKLLEKRLRKKKKERKVAEKDLQLARQNKDQQAKKEMKELISKLKAQIKKIKKKLGKGEAAEKTELTPPAGAEPNFEELWEEFGNDLRDWWCMEHGCEDFDARVANLDSEILLRRL